MAGKGERVGSQGPRGGAQRCIPCETANPRRVRPQLTLCGQTAAWLPELEGRMFLSYEAGRVGGRPGSLGWAVVPLALSSPHAVTRGPKFGPCCLQASPFVHSAGAEANLAQQVGAGAEP